MPCNIKSRDGYKTYFIYAKLIFRVTDEAKDTRVFFKKLNAVGEIPEEKSLVIADVVRH